jgi:hypothetical protein
LSSTRRPDSSKPIGLYVTLWRPYIWHYTMAMPRVDGIFSDGKLSNECVCVCVCMCMFIRVIAETAHSQDWIKTFLNCNMLYCPILPFWSLPEKCVFDRFVWNRYVYKEGSVFWKLKEKCLIFPPRHFNFPSTVYCLL